MNPAERLIIICLLASRSMEVKKVVEFVNVMQEGIIRREPDSISYKDDLIKTAKLMPLEGMYGEIIGFLLQLHQLNESISKVAASAHYVENLMKAFDSAGSGKLGERVVLSKLSAFMKRQPAV